MLVRTDKELLKTMTEEQLVERVINNVTREINRLYEISNKGITKVKIEHTKDNRFDIKLVTKDKGTLIMVKDMEYFTREDINKLQLSLRNTMTKNNEVPIIVIEGSELTKNA